MWSRVSRFSEVSNADLAAAAAWLIAAIALYHRLPYGVSHGDEAFYNAMPYSFAIGNRPYFDELAIHQNAGVLLVPFYRIYLAIAGSADGIILFNRYLYFVLAGFSSWLTYRVVKRVERGSTGCWAAALVLTFSYFNIFSLSYNTQGAFCFLCGTLCAASALLDARPGRMLFVASLFLVSGVFSYPGLVVVFVPYTGLVLAWLLRKAPASARQSGLRGLGAGAVLALAVAVPLVIGIGKDNFRRLIAFQQSLGYLTQSALHRFDFYHSGAWAWRWSLLVFAAFFAAWPYLYSLPKRHVWLLALASIAALWGCYRQCLTTPSASGAMLFLLALPILTPVCIALNRDWRHGPFVLQLIWAPSVLSMMATTYTSSNGYAATSLGALGVLVSGAASFGAYLEALAEKNAGQRWGYEVGLAAFLATCLAIQVDSLYGGAYDVDSVLANLTTRVHAGPFRGTITDHNEAVFAEAIDRDLKQIATDSGTLLVFDNFPTGYLSTRLRPRTWCTWIDWMVDPAYLREAMAENFGRPEQLPDFLLEVHMSDIARSFWAPYAQDYRVIVDRSDLDYRILRRVRARKKAKHPNRNRD
ncbi:MAG TPA: hypothetical protein VGL19_02110 [Polyangiaceae bacterium]